MDFATTQVAKLDRCEDLLIFRLEKPSGYAYRAGQWFRVRLDTESGEQTRVFSHAAAPSDRYIEFATRASDSSFKRALSQLGEGQSIAVSAAGGRLALPAEDAVTFLVGGVGITPVRSLLRDALSRDVSMNGWVLVYGNRDFECVPFKEDLAAFERQGLQVVHVLESGEGPEGFEKGFITAPMIERHGGVAGRQFVVAGPPAMVRAMKDVLDLLEVSEEARTVEAFGPTTTELRPDSPAPAAVGNKRH